MLLNIDEFKTIKNSYSLIATGDYELYCKNKLVVSETLSYSDIDTVLNVGIENAVVVLFEPIESEKKQALISKYKVVLISDLIDKKASEFWDKKKTYIGVDLNHYCSNDIICKRIEKLNSVDIEKILIEKSIADNKKLRVLSLGCGTGFLERKLAKLNICEKIDGLDISIESINEARQLAKKAGYENLINYDVTNLNKDCLKEKGYDVILAHSCMHHIYNLDFAYSNINSALTENGIFIQFEYVGADRFQWSDERINIVNNILKWLPSRYKNRKKYERTLLKNIINADPSEAIRSSEIIEKVKENFDDVKLMYFYGTIMHILYQCINPKYFHPTSFMNILRTKILLYITLLLDRKYIKQNISDNVMALCRKKIIKKVIMNKRHSKEISVVAQGANIDKQ